MEQNFEIVFKMVKSGYFMAAHSSDSLHSHLYLVELAQYPCLYLLSISQYLIFQKFCFRSNERRGSANPLPRRTYTF